MNSSTNNFVFADRLKQVCNALDVYVKGKKVATLNREAGEFLLKYLPCATGKDFISITMPVRAAPWRSDKLHPFFQMNLPEGAMLDGVMKKFGLDVATDHMALLGLVGTSLIGAVKVVPSGVPVDWRTAPDINIDKLMHATDASEYFDIMIDECVGQGVSGIMPKVLSNNERSRYTVTGENWIYKHDRATGFTEEFVGASMNEYLSLRAAARSGLTVTDCAISDDGHTIAIKRFDKDGERFEDFCSLIGRPGRNKYDGSMERMAMVIEKISRSPVQDKEILVRAHILNMIVGNGDAHMKNFGVLYNELDDIRLSPTFDVVTVRAFKRLYEDVPALFMNGEKEWTLSDDFLQFASLSCGVHPAKVFNIIEEVINAVETTMKEVAHAGNKHAWFREHAKNMILIWNEGIAMALNEIMDDKTTILSKYKMSGVKELEFDYGANGFTM